MVSCGGGVGFTKIWISNVSVLLRYLRVWYDKVNYVFGEGVIN